MSKDLVEECVRPIFIPPDVAMFELKHDCHFELILNAVHHNQFTGVEGQVALRLDGEAWFHKLIETLFAKLRIRFYLSKRLTNPFTHLFHVIICLSLHD